MRLKPQYYLLSIALGFATAQHMAAHAAESNSRAPQPQACPQVVWRFLPGDYNLCLGVRFWLSGRYREAERLLTLAAGWGSKPAQHLLGRAYFSGDHLNQNKPLGLAWLKIAAERRSPEYVASLESAARLASVDERRAANREYDNLQKVYSDDVAAVRAQQRYERELQAIAGNPVYIRGNCIKGLNRSELSTVSAEYYESCPTRTEVVTQIQGFADLYFEGWKGDVSVGAPENVSTPD